MKIIQFVSNLSFADAVSNNCRIIRDKFSALGFESEIYAGHFDSFSEKETNHYLEYKGDKRNILLMHASTYTEMHDYIKMLPDRKVLLYHNITPPDFFSGFNDFFVKHLTKGRNQLKELSKIYEFAVSFSEFNLKDLREVGFKKVFKIPLYLDFSKYQKKFVPIDNKLNKNILFVGRFAPNKKQDDLIKFFYFYKKYFDQNISLTLIGDFKGQENYYGRILELIDFLGLNGFVRILNCVSDELLFENFQSSDIFLSMSEHEGFFVPAIESFYFDLPLLAFDAGAVSETMNGGGIVFQEKNFDDISKIVWKILNVSTFREKLLEKQKSSLSNFISLNDDFKLLKILRENFRL
jgi:L-malate glycosyltransferase